MSIYTHSCFTGRITETQHNPESKENRMNAKRSGEKKVDPKCEK